MIMKIRDATSDDCEIIARYNSAMAAETEGIALEATTICSGVAALLDDRAKGRYWVAEIGNKIVGQLMVTYEWSDWRNGTLWWIQSVYVKPEYRRQGVFSALYRHVELLASEAHDVRGIRLYVERGNRRAQKTYEALGMVSSGYRVMESMFE